MKTRRPFPATALGHEPIEFTLTPPGQEGIVAGINDGATENARGEAFGKERPNDIVRRNSHLGAEGLAGTIMESLNAFCGSLTQHDNLTLVVIHAL